MKLSELRGLVWSVVEENIRNHINFVLNYDFVGNGDLCDLN